MDASGMRLEFGDLQLFSQVEEDVRPVIASLHEWGCCALCVLRALGEHQQEVLTRPLADIEAWIQSCIKSKESDKNGCQQETNISASDDQPVCCLCLGILQQKFSVEEFITRIAEEVKSSNHEFTHFSCALSFPVSILLREHALWITLREKFKSVFYGHSKEDMVFLKEIWKWRNGPALAVKLDAVEEKRSQFEVSLNFIHPDSEKECAFLLDVFPNMFRRRKQVLTSWELYTRTNVAKALKDMSDGKFSRCYCCPPKRLLSSCSCDNISTCQEAIFIAGRYLKYSRDLSQTPWLIEGQRKTESSIQELLCDPVVEVFKCTDHRFSSAGREDVDVRCLGNGRPFLVELMDPHVVTVSKESMKALQKRINEATDQIAVKYLQVVDRVQSTILKEGEMEKTKSYSAYCWSAKELSQEKLDELLKIQDLKLNQKTPIRVLHRRPLADRERVIHQLVAKKTDSHHFSLSLKTQAGTYIKEFVHGDFGRTKPSLGDLLGADCDILELDVESVDVDWPPPTDSD